MQYIATRPFLDLYERDTRRPVSRVSLRWWEEDGRDLEWAKKRAVETTTILESESEPEEESEVEANEDSDRDEESQGVIGSSGAEWSGADE